jgi:hypothetical protein
MARVEATWLGWTFHLSRRRFMKTSQSRVLAVLLAAVLVVGGANLAAYAANGNPLLLGKTNTASKTTTLKYGKGTPLFLKAKKNKPPLKVNNKTKVAKLNADLLDGHDGASLQNKTYTYALTGTSAAAGLIRFSLPGLPGGKYLATYSVNALLSGASTFFGCTFDSGLPFANSTLPNLGATGGANQWYVSASGVVDTTALTYTLTCQSGGGTTITVPNAPLAAQATFTRLDLVTPGTGTGSKVSAPSGSGFAH